jgi:hypothetical protein
MSQLRIATSCLNMDELTLGSVGRAQNTIVLVDKHLTRLRHEEDPPQGAVDTEQSESPRHQCSRMG